MTGNTGFTGFTGSGGGGGGGTVDNSTPPYLVYKGIDGTFRDSPLVWLFPLTDFDEMRSEAEQFNFLQNSSSDDQQSAVLFATSNVNVDFNVNGNMTTFFRLQKEAGTDDESFIFQVGEGTNLIYVIYDIPENNSYIEIGDVNFGFHPKIGLYNTTTGPYAGDTMLLFTPTGLINIQNLQSFDNNADAVAALGTNMLWKKTDLAGDTLIAITT